MLINKILFVCRSIRSSILNYLKQFTTFEFAFKLIEWCILIPPRTGKISMISFSICTVYRSCRSLFYISFFFSDKGELEVIHLHLFYFKFNLLNKRIYNGRR